MAAPRPEPRHRPGAESMRAVHMHCSAYFALMARASSQLRGEGGRVCECVCVHVWGGKCGGGGGEGGGAHMRGMRGGRG